jgi:heat-inducible transcriptional repressor
MAISIRQHEILMKTLELYIQTGNPVGSNALTEVVDTSSSTIRAEFAALESEGLLTHPHTSAGRVPTDAGYRYYADALIAKDLHEEETIFKVPESYGNVDELLQGVAEGMSEVTRLLAVVAGPSGLGDPVSRVDHLSLCEGTHLIIVSTENGHASSTTITLPSSVEDEELHEILRSLNAFLGDRSTDTHPIAAARRFLADDYDPLTVGALLKATEVLSRATERGLFIQGVSALFEGLEPDSLAVLVEILERRRWLLKLFSDGLERSISNSSEVFVSIGAESGYYNLGSTSLVAATYHHRERPYDFVILIGPKRMEYDAAISTVCSAAETLTYCLDSRF